MRLLTLILVCILPFSVFAQSKKDKQRYNAYIKSADSAFDAKNYPFAIEKYKAASVIKPKEQYPIDRKAESDKKYIEQNMEYKRIIKLADSCFGKGNWADAKSYYISANLVKPYDSYSSDQAKNCNYHIVAKEAMDQRYDELIRKADSCFNSKSWACAKANYVSASNTKPDEQYPKERIVTCDANMQANVNNERYNLTITDADNQFDAGNYDRAKELYNDALKIKPNSQYAADRIRLCDEKLNAPK